MSVGGRIKEKRKELKISAEELGKKIGKDRATIYRYENGDIEKFPLDILEPIASALDTTPQYLLGWEEEQKKNAEQVDITLRMRSDKKFMDAVSLLYKLDGEKLDSVMPLLSTLCK